MSIDVDDAMAQNESQVNIDNRFAEIRLLFGLRDMYHDDIVGTVVMKSLTRAVSPSPG